VGGQKVIPRPSADYFVVGRRQKNCASFKFRETLQQPYPGTQAVFKSDRESDPKSDASVSDRESYLHPICMKSVGKSDRESDAKTYV
jgi:hypothetical protein